MQKPNRTLLIKNIKDMPVFQCDRCIEYSIEDSVMEKVDYILSRVDVTSELEIVRYAA